MKQKEVTGNSQHEFHTDKSCLSEQIHFGENLAGFGDEGRAVDIVFNKAVGTLSFTALFKLGGCGLVGNQRGETGWMGLMGHV